MYQTPSRSEAGRTGGFFLLPPAGHMVTDTGHDLEFGHLVPTDLYTYRMPSEAKKAEYNANKKARRHREKWLLDPNTHALQAEMRQVRATLDFARASMLYEAQQPR